CTGDCDSDTDCLPTLKCFKRGDGESTQVPGCGTGGVGDIPGADYCYDPSNGDVSRVNGCTPSTQCNICSGDCDNDEDCIGDYLCFKRADGMKNQVPGCEIGGIGDISGADYCYDPSGGGLSPTGSPSVGGVMTDAPQVATLNPSVSPTFALPSKVSPLPTDINLLVGNPFATPSAAPTSSLPSLRYHGRNMCTADSPCGACSGDCDGDSGCQTGLMCFQRARDETSQVPGCAVGGTEDIPGADYCYDPTSESPPLVWLGEDGCSEDQPCNRCAGSCSNDEDCKGNLECFVRIDGESTSVPGCSSGGIGDVLEDYCYDPDAAFTPSPTRTPSSLPTLRWRGSEGCSPDSPCPSCTGDCDNDNDCDSTLKCFKRFAGDRTQVPGCATGGLGDIPGGDYC
ncbi:hypothetical protein THAPSDRAFT_262378, partial [Thalassiosira pseudonana CCMP1335]